MVHRNKVAELKAAGELAKARALAEKAGGAAEEEAAGGAAGDAAAGSADIRVYTASRAEVKAAMNLKLVRIRRALVAFAVKFCPKTNLQDLYSPITVRCLARLRSEGSALPGKDGTVNDDMAASLVVHKEQIKRR